MGVSTASPDADPVGATQVVTAGHGRLIAMTREHADDPRIAALPGALTVGEGGERVARMVSTTTRTGAERMTEYDPSTAPRRLEDGFKN